MKKPIMFRQQNPKTSAQMKLAEQLLTNGSSTAPVRHPLEGWGRLAQALSGAYIQNRAADKDTADRNAANAGMLKGLFAKQWDIPEGEIVLNGKDGAPISHAEAESNAAPAGGLAGAAYALSQMPDNFYAQQKAPELAMQDAMRKQARLDKETDRFNADASARSNAEFAHELALERDSHQASLKAPAQDKFGAPSVIADPQSPTGYSRVRINQAGEKQVIGPAPVPRKMFDADAPRKKAKFAATGKRYEEATAQINEADKVLGEVQSMLSLVEKVDSGAFAETRLEFKKRAQALGFDVDEKSIANAEAMRAKGMDFIMQRISETKGAISEKEMAAFEKASASLRNTPQGNRMILDLARRVSERMKFEATAVREAYGNNPDISLFELDNVRLKARKEFGDLVGGGDPKAGRSTGGLSESERRELEQLRNEVR